MLCKLRVYGWKFSLKKIAISELAVHKNTETLKVLFLYKGSD
jgi:hypothetical protein